MRILSAKVRNYRLHRDMTISFDRERTLIGGPNETGKSTLVEAIHRALFLRAKGATALHRAMESTTHGGKPEVELVFEAVGTTYRLHKRFSGNSGTTTLTPEGAPALNGEAAETELAHLLKVEQTTGQAAVPQQWAHLWVWQGVSGGDPAQHANQNRDMLLQRLGQSGGAAIVMQSEIDARVAERFASACESIFTQRGEAKATSELAKLTDTLAEARTAQALALERLDRVRKAFETHAQSSALLVTLASDLANLTKEQADISSRRHRVEHLRQQETTESAEARAIESALSALRQIDREIRELRTRTATATEALAPRNAELERLADSAERHRLAATEAAKAYDATTDATRRIRLEHELATACVALLEKRQTLAKLAERAASASTISKGITELRDTLARLPSIDSAQVKRLRKLEETCSTTKAALEAMAAGIEVLTADQPVALEGLSLTTGQLTVVTQDAEIQVGTGTRIRIRPGGGANLVQARDAATDTRRQLQALLDELHVANSSAAQDIATQRSGLDARIEAEGKRLEDLDAEVLPKELETARNAEVAVQNEINRIAVDLDVPDPNESDPARARTRASIVSQNLHDAELAERKARAARDAAAQLHSAASETLTKERTRIEQDRRALHELEAQLRLLLERHGDDASRTQQLDAATATAQKATGTLAATRQKLAELQPEHLNADQKRIERALATAKAAQQDAATQQAVAEETLRNDGSLDPQADLELARGRVASLEDRHVSVRRHAQAVRLLDELFRAEQQSLADQYTRPLVDRVSTYLQCIFGPGARIEIRFENQEFGQHHLIRPALHHGAIPFNDLSGGTKEQVASAMRLAMAEILAADHDGCLPIVFDDAFAYSDPDRAQTLQRMLDLAATRGLQVIVLTCTPSDYRALGARAITLTPAAPSAPESSRLVPTTDQESVITTGDDPGVSVTDLDRTQFIDALRSRGGSSGNGSLRETLGWSESFYDAVKQDLIAAARIVPGKGRGGSVSLP